jgi:hypothetical protein
LSGLNAVMPAAMRAVFGPRSCGRAFPDLERECERGFGGLERTEAERVLTGWARCRRRARGRMPGAGSAASCWRPVPEPIGRSPVGASRDAAADLTRNRGGSRQAKARSDRRRAPTW